MALSNIASLLPSPLNSLSGFGLVVLVVWVLAWKGFALWKAARLRQPVWFVVILLINTMGILEILYIFVFSQFGFDHLKMKKMNKARKK